jgi:hypothetical protein
MNDKLQAVKDKVAAKEAAKQAILAKHKTEKGKKLTADKRLDRIEELLGIKDE